MASKQLLKQFSYIFWYFLQHFFRKIIRQFSYWISVEIASANDLGTLSDISWNLNNILRIFFCTFSQTFSTIPLQISSTLFWSLFWWFLLKFSRLFIPSTLGSFSGFFGNVFEIPFDGISSVVSLEILSQFFMEKFLGQISSVNWKLLRQLF